MRINEGTFIVGATEQVTFVAGRTNQVSGVTGAVDGANAQVLPITVTGHHRVVVGVGFTGNSGGSADIVISGSDGGGKTDTIDQTTGLPFAHRGYST
jgi:hypothetical protein